MTLTDLVLLSLVGMAGMAAGSLLTRWWAARGQPAGRTDAPAAPTPAVASWEPPATPPPAATAEPRPPVRPAAIEPAWSADVLVVDDSAVARAKLRRLLEQHGYSVHLARDGVEALQRLDAGRYGLMISDLEMPNMDGIELINTCLGRPQTARMPILAVSGHENLRVRFNACRDICGVHRKPWVDDVLASHVAALVGLRTPRPRSGVEQAIA